MNKHKLSSLLLITGILLSGIFSFPGAIAQGNYEKYLKRYSTPDSINPLNININEFLAEDLGALKLAAEMAYRKGEYLEAARLFLYMVNRNTDDSDSYYKIAACYSKLGKLDYAINFLVLAINAGYVDFEMIEAEEAFNVLRINPGTKSRYRELIAYGDKYGEIKYYRVTRLEKCLLFLPPDYDPDKKYPLIIGLHGNASNPYLFSDLWRYIKDEGVIYAVPQSPYTYTTRGGTLTQQYSWSIISRERSLWEIADPLVTGYFVNIAKRISEEYNTGKIILFGFSQGAGFGYAGGIKYHDIFDGLICFGGRLPDPVEYPWFLSSEDLEANSDIKVFIAHGTTDQSIGVSEARKSNRILKKNGYTTRLEIFEGGHYVPGDILKQGIRWILERE
ncbi:MAG: hypothetical protein JW965_05785 [Bacteroidales bacterium]|nr:hypothetical protein [Bacteroidales bacterium]